MIRFHAERSDEFDAKGDECGIPSESAYDLTALPAYQYRPDCLRFSHRVNKILWEYGDTQAVESSAKHAKMFVSKDLGTAALYILHSLTPFRVEHYTGPIKAKIQDNVDCKLGLSLSSIHRSIGVFVYEACLYAVSLPGVRSRDTEMSTRLVHELEISYHYNGENFTLQELLVRLIKLDADLREGRHPSVETGVVTDRIRDAAINASIANACTIAKTLKSGAHESTAPKARGKAKKRSDAGTSEPVTEPVTKSTPRSSARGRTKAKPVAGAGTATLEVDSSSGSGSDSDSSDTGKVVKVPLASVRATRTSKAKSASTETKNKEAVQESKCPKCKSQVSNAGK